MQGAGAPVPMCAAHCNSTRYLPTTVQLDHSTALCIHGTVDPCRTPRSSTIRQPAIPAIPAIPAHGRTRRHARARARGVLGPARKDCGGLQERTSQTEPMKYYDLLV